MNKRRLAFGAALIGVANVIRICLQLVMLPILARLVGPEEFGTFALAMPTIMFVMMLADGGLGASLAREQNSNQILWSSAFWTLIIAALTLGVVVFSATFIIAPFVHQPRLPQVMGTLCACLVLYALSIPSGARLLRQGNLAASAVADVFSNVLGAIAAVAFAYNGAGVWSLVIQSLTLYSVRSAVLFVNAPVVPTCEFSYAVLKPHLEMGTAIVGTKLVDAGDRTIENWIVGKIFGSVYLGSFSLAYQVSRFFSDAVTNPLWITLYARALHLNDDERRHLYQRFARLAAVILFPAAAIVAPQSKEMINLLLGPKWSHMSPLLELFILSYAVSAVAGLGGAILYAKGRTELQLRITLETAIIRILCVLMALAFGLPMVWIGLPLSNLYLAYRTLSVVSRTISAVKRALIRPLIVPTGCSVLTGLVCWRLAIVTRGDFLSVVGVSAVCFILYASLLLLWDRKELMKDLDDAYSILFSGRGDQRAILPTDR